MAAVHHFAHGAANLDDCHLRAGCAALLRALDDARYGDGSVSGRAPNARDLLTLGGVKHGLSRADIGPPINLFKTVRVADDGSLTLDAPADLAADGTRIPFVPGAGELTAGLDLAVAGAFARWKVQGFFADVREWESFAKVSWPAAFGDEGAANHTRLCARHGDPGVELSDLFA